MTLSMVEKLFKMQDLQIHGYTKKEASNQKHKRENIKKNQKQEKNR